MSFLMFEPKIFQRGFVSPELRTNSIVDQFRQIVCDINIGAQTKKHESIFAILVFLSPNAAIAKLSDCANTAVQRNTLLPVCFILPPFTGRVAQFNISERKIIPIK